MKLTDWTHHLWKPFLFDGATAIDTTCGSGHDTLFLAEQCGRVIAYDIQQEAIEKTKARLAKAGLVNVQLRHSCHSKIDEPAHLIVYNLGYLPGSDKAITTLLETTLQSLEKAKRLLLPGGAISLMCYDGHPTGEEETSALMHWAQGLERTQWAVYLHRLWNTQRGPKTLLMQKLDCGANEVKRSTN